MDTFARIGLIVWATAWDGLNPVQAICRDQLCHPVFGYVSAGGNTALTGFDLAIDFGAANYGLGATGFTNFGVNNVNKDFIVSPTTVSTTTIVNQSLGLDTTAAPNLVDPLQGAYNPNDVPFDFVVNLTAAPNQNLSTDAATPTHLFNITFGTTAGMDSQRFSIVAKVGNGSAVLDTNNQVLEGPYTVTPGTLGTLTTFGGSFEVQAVPEPSSMLLLGLATGGFALRRAYRRKTSANEE